MVFILGLSEEHVSKKSLEDFLPSQPPSEVALFVAFHFEKKHAKHVSKYRDHLLNKKNTEMKETQRNQK